MEGLYKISNYFRKSFLVGMVYSILFILVGAVQFACISTLEAQSVDQAIAKLQAIHSRLRLIHGSFAEEYPEQLMTAMYLSENAKVMELGGNFGRNSCVIGAILNDSRNLVTVEPHPDYISLLQQNRDVNELHFHIEASAISKVPLIQREWKTIQSDVDIPGYVRVNTVTFDEVQAKYGIVFDTLIVDCEGALYYMLLEDPDMLRNINMVIIENDFDDVPQMLYVQDLFKKNGLQCVYNQGYYEAWRACGEYFFQVWKK